MSITVEAVFEDGAFRPLQPLPPLTLSLAEGETVEITVKKIQPAEPPSEEELARRMKAVKSLQELFEVIDTQPPWPDDYDILQALEDNRRWSAGLPPKQRESEVR